MLRISFQTLRARRGTLAGAFVAIWLAVTLAYGTGLLMAAALSPPGPGRFAAADAVVRADPSVATADGESEDVLPAPRLDTALVSRVAGAPGVARAVGDIAFPVGAWNQHGARLTADTLYGHGWASATLTPYTLSAGRAPAGTHDVVADTRLGTHVGARLRIATPAGEATYRVTGLTHGPQPTLFFADTVAARLAGAPGKVNAIAVQAAPGVSPATLRDRLATALAQPGDGRATASLPPAAARVATASAPPAAARGAAASPLPVAARGATASAPPAAARGGAASQPRLEVLDRAHAADADAGDSRAADRVALIAIFGVMGGISGAVALFVVAGTFALAIVQRRREVAVMRALGAAPHQVRRLIAGEALIVSVVAGLLGLVAGRPLADAIVAVLGDHGVVPPGFAPSHSWIPLVAALGGGIVIAQVAVFAAARRAGRTRPAEALREVAVEHPRPGVLQLVVGLACIGGGVAMAIVFSGMWAVAFAILEGLLLAVGVGLLGRWLLGLPAAALAWPLRHLGASGLLASTSLAANRWRTAALATPIVLVAMLAGTQGVVQSSGQRDTERVTAARVTAPHVVAGRDGAPLPAGTAERIASLPGVDAVTATSTTFVYPQNAALGEESPWPAAGLSGRDTARTLDLRVTAGALEDVQGDAVAVSRVFTHAGHLRVGDVFTAKLADTTSRSLRVAAVYDRAAGLGDIVLDASLVDAPAAAVFVAGGADAQRSLERYAATRRGVQVMTRAQYRDGVHTTNQEQAWAVWMIIGLSALFAGLALINTAAMSTAERRGELATIRLLGGTPGQAARTVALEILPTVLVALGAGAAVVWVSVSGVPRGITGFPLTVPTTLVLGLVAGATALGLLAALVTTRLALRASPTEATQT